jgi:hypothetical protein
VRWADSNQVEQDLVLSRLIIEIAHHPLLGQELVFRGRHVLSQAVARSAVAVQRRSRLRAPKRQVPQMSDIIGPWINL